MCIRDRAKDIIFGQLRLVIATRDIEEINTDRDKFLEAVSRNVEGELKKIGLRLINVNVTDISDESGYIDALGKEAAAKAINDAKKNVAERDRDGSCLLYTSPAGGGVEGPGIPGPGGRRGRPGPGGRPAGGPPPARRTTPPPTSPGSWRTRPPPSPAW